MATKIVSVNDGTRLTVSDLVGAPTVIPARTLDMMENQFLVDSVLRSGDDTKSGVVVFWESESLYTDDDPSVLDEFAQIPVVTDSVGARKVVRTVRRAFAIRVSKTMIDRNQMRRVTNQMRKCKNTMIRTWEDAFFSAIIANANVQTLITDTPWGAADSHMRKDINSAKFLVRTASFDAAGKQRFGFRADTLIISDEAELDMLDSDELNSVYQGNIADESIKYTGKLPNKILGLDVLVSWRLNVYAPNAAMVLQRKDLGFISDERPLESTSMYPEGGGGNGGPREAFRADVTRQSAIGLDQPKACVVLAGVTTGETFPTTGSTVS